MGDKVPSHFEVDVSKLELGERIGLETLNYLPAGLVINEKVRVTHCQRFLVHLRYQRTSAGCMWTLDWS